MDAKLELAIKTIFDSLTTTWEDNGNVMADAVRDSVINNLSNITGDSIADIEKKVNNLIEDAQ